MNFFSLTNLEEEYCSKKYAKHFHHSALVSDFLQRTRHAGPHDCFDQLVHSKLLSFNLISLIQNNNFWHLPLPHYDVHTHNYTLCISPNKISLVEHNFIISRKHPIHLFFELFPTTNTAFSKHAYIMLCNLYFF